MDNRFEIFTALIAKIARNVKKIKNQEMAEYELKSAPACCLYYLYTNETLTATELCTAEGIRPSNADTSEPA